MLKSNSAYHKIEGSKKLKIKYLRKTNWWQTFNFIPPALLLFVGVVGILYMFNADRLITWYTLPYVVIFALGTVWLKAIKKHQYDIFLNDKEAFKVCLSVMIGEQGGYKYFVFRKDKKRDQSSVILKDAKNIKFDELSDTQKKDAINKAISVREAEYDYESPIYMKAIKGGVKTKGCQEGGVTPLFYLTDDNIFVVEAKDIK